MVKILDFDCMRNLWQFFNVYICLIYLLSMQALIFVVENTSAKPFMY